MAEEPHMPTVDEIRERAIELWMMDHKGEIAIVPEDEELKESTVQTGPYAGMTYWEAARKDLMSRKEKTEMEKMLAYYESQVRELREALGKKTEVTPEEYEAIREQLREIRSKYRETKRKLKETVEELERVRRAYEEAMMRMAERPTPAPPKLPRIHATRVEVDKYATGGYYINLLNPEKYGDRPIMTIQVSTIKELEEALAKGEAEYNVRELGLIPEHFAGEEWYEMLPEELKHNAIIYWNPEDIVFSDEVQRDRLIYHKTYTREELEGLSVDELRRICRVKGLSAEGKKEDLINRILGGIPAPKFNIGENVLWGYATFKVLDRKWMDGKWYYKLENVASLIPEFELRKKEEAPPEKAEEAPPAIPPPPKETGLSKADIERLRNQFFAELSKAGVRITTGIRAEFNYEIDVLREELKDIEREKAYSLAKRRLDELVQQIVSRERRRREERRRPPTVPTPLIPAVEVPVTPITGRPRPWGVWAPILYAGPTRAEVEKYASQMRPIEPDERDAFLFWLRSIGISIETYERLPEGVKSKIRAEFRRAYYGNG